ncbi:MAG: hypothetical protein ACI89J_002382 [Hyphomicrobiaceae bacterium]|jgi:hypothetical protein
MHDDLIFDENGKSWPTNSMELRHHLGATASAPELSEYLTKNSGYVRVVSHSDRALIVFRPSVVDDRSIVSLYYHLVDHQFRSLALKAFDDTNNCWRYEILGSCDNAVRIIGAMLEDEVTRLHTSSYLSREVPFRSANQHSLLQEGIDFHQRLNGHLSSHHISSLPEHLMGRHMLYRVNKGEGEIILASIGGSFPKPIENYLYQAIGRDIRDRPDSAYGNECAADYASVASSNKPTCFEVDTISKWAAGDLRLRRRYRRVILPFSDEFGQQWLLGQSLPDNSVNLRAMAG